MRTLQYTEAGYDLETDEFYCQCLKNLSCSDTISI